MLTVVVCTYNRSFILRECLESLMQQSADPEVFDLVLVDNNSTDATRECFQKICSRRQNTRIVFESRQGLAYARNRGLEEAHTEWVAFLDDDAKAHPDWVKNILATVKKDDFDCFGGPYYAWHRFGPPPKWFAAEWEAYVPPQPYGSLGDRYIPGGNCAFRRSFAFRAGSFPESYGMRGKKCGYAEETLLFERMRQKGARLGFVPAMSIEHCVLPYKYTLRWRLVSMFARGRDGTQAFVQTVTGKDLCRAFRDLLREQIIRAPWRFLDALRYGHAWQRAVVDVFSPIVHHFGRLSALISILIASKAEKNHRDL